MSLSYVITIQSMLDVIDIGCPILRTPFFEQAITLLGYFGHGAVGVAIALALLAHGYLCDHERNRRAGMAVLLALITIGIFTELLKNTIQLPRPKLRSSYGFPSGHTGTAFSLAMTLSATFPALGWVFFCLAALTGMSRLYLRYHYTVDVIGGLLLGVVVGFPIAKKFIPRPARYDPGSLRLVGWAVAAALGIGSLAFFYSSERNIAAHMAPAQPGKSPAELALFDFGTGQARPLLRYGWSGDESWEGGKRSVVWANGLASEIVMPLPAQQDYRFLIEVYPYSPKGPACQRVEVRINDTPVAKIFLEQGWHGYYFDVAKTGVQAGNNRIQFLYDYAEPPKLRGRNPDDRALSVAFDRIQVFARN